MKTKVIVTYGILFLPRGEAFYPLVNPQARIDLIGWGCFYCG